MSFAAPGALAGLLLLPLLLLLYIWTRRRRRRFALRYSSLSLLGDAVSREATMRRHAPVALYLAAVAVLVLAAARPQATLVEPEARGTVILALDVSGSMRNTDIAPSRIEAAKAAIRAFVGNEPRGVRIGLVAFANSAMLVVPPTTDHKQVLASARVLQLTRGTNIGDGLRVAVQALASDDAVAEAVPREGPPVDVPGRLGVDPATATIVLLSDGAATTGPDPVAMARQVAALGVKTHTVGLGTTTGVFQGGGFAMRLDEPTLRAIADITGGHYFTAQDAAELNRIYSELAKSFEVVRQWSDITFAFGGVALILLLAGLGAGAFLQGRLP